MQQTKHFLLWMYGALYLATAISLATIEYTSIKVGWPWISHLVMPMGIVFLCVNIPLASFAILKIGHVLFLHSVQHHSNVMRSIREKDVAFNASLPHREIDNTKILDESGTVSHSLGTHGTPVLSVPLSQSVPQKMPTTPDDFNVTVHYYLSQYPQASIREVERATSIPKSNIGRTPAWKNRSR